MQDGVIVKQSPHPFRRWSDHLIRHGQQPALGVALGLAVTAVIAVIGGVIDPGMGRSVAGFFLVIPVVIAGVVGGRVPAYAVAVVAGLSYSLHLPPVGSPRVDLTQDVVAMVILLGVGLVISTLVTGRIEALTRLDHDRALLLRSVSHDLRTPLAAILTAATDLLDESIDEADPATRRHLVTLIEHDALRLDRLVSNLLSLSRIEANAMRPQREPVDVGQLVVQAVSSARETSAGSGIRLALGPQAAEARADPVMIDQVVTNLVDNAIRHSPPGAAVDVSVGVDRTGRAAGHITVVVADRGPGVSPAEVDQIFQPFRSGHIAGSSGVGLAICRAIITAHDGTISVHERDGGGAEFVVKLPLG